MTWFAKVSIRGCEVLFPAARLFLLPLLLLFVCMSGSEASSGRPESEEFFEKFNKLDQVGRAAYCSAILTWGGKHLAILSTAYNDADIADELRRLAVDMYMNEWLYSYSIIEQSLSPDDELSLLRLALAHKEARASYMEYVFADDHGWVQRAEPYIESCRQFWVAQKQDGRVPRELLVRAEAFAYETVEELTQ